MARSSFAILWLNAGTARAQAKEDGLFGLTKVHEFHLNFAAADYQKMQPPPGMKFPGFGPKQPAPKRATVDAMPQVPSPSAAVDAASAPPAPTAPASAPSWSQRPAAAEEESRRLFRRRKP